MPEALLPEFREVMDSLSKQFKAKERERFAKEAKRLEQVLPSKEGLLVTSMRETKKRAKDVIRNLQTAKFVVDKPRRRGLGEDSNS
jgi:predicted lipase